MDKNIYSISSEFLSLIDLVKFVGEEILKVYNKDFNTDIKDDNSPVTEADYLANELIIKHIKLHFSKFGIISEEVLDNEDTYKNENIFVIDPVDGTKGFVEKNGEFSIMVGILKNLRPYFGIVYEPVSKKLYFAERGFGSFVELSNGKILKLKTSIIDDFSSARMLRSRNHFSFRERCLCEFLNLPKFSHIGSIGIKCSKISSQENELYVNLSKCLGKWDTCAPQVIVEEAGGECYDKFGFELDYSKVHSKMDNGFIATNGKLNKREILSAVLKTEMMNSKR